MVKIIQVGIAQLGVVRAPDEIETRALGSCVGVAMYDVLTGTGGIAHAMLPDIGSARKGGRGNRAKFVDSALIDLLRLMERKGVKKENIKAKVAGGANMFPAFTVRGREHVGKRNSGAALSRLRKMGIPVVAEDTGGSEGRTIRLNAATGGLTVHSLAHGEKVI